MKFRLSEREAKRLSDELRNDGGPFLRNRRAIAVLSLVASGSMGLIVLYQLGIIRHLPDVPLPKLDADKVDAAPEAYEMLSMPDAALGLASYAATLMLAAADGPDRHGTAPWLPITMAAKVAVDALNAGRLSIDQWTRHRAFCIWCLIAAGATFATVPLALPEARAALRDSVLHVSRSSEAEAKIDR